MTTADRMETTVWGTGTHVSERKNARVSISHMSSSELLRFGVSAKFRLSQGPTPDDPGLADLAARLNEARSEWNRRHPDLPLRDSF